MSQAQMIPIIKFLFHAELPVLGDVLKSGYKVEEYFDSEKLLNALSSQPAGLVIASLKDKKDLLELASFLKRMKVVAKDTAIKIAAVNISGDRNFEKAAMKLGIQDLIEPAINARALKFKIDFWMKSLAAQAKNTAPITQKTSKPQETKGPESQSTDSKEAVWLAPMELESDIWVLRNDQDCKKVLNKWLVKILGPSPYVSEWKEVKEGLWELNIKDSIKEMLVSDSGSWFFRGSQKPDFLWSENLWLITGDNYELYFKDSLGIKSRLKSEKNIMTITKNSLFAKTKEPLLIESCDKNLLIKKESDHLDNLEGKGDASDVLKGKLSGGIEKQDPTKSAHWNTKSSFKEKESPVLTAPNQSGINSGKNLELENKEKTHETFYRNHNEATQYEGKDPTSKTSTDHLGEGKTLDLKPTNTKIEKYYKNGTEVGVKEEEKSDEKSPSDPLAKEKNLGLKPTNTKIEKYYKNGAEVGVKEEEKSKEKSSSERLAEEKNLGLKPTDTNLEKYYKNGAEVGVKEEEEKSKEKSSSERLAEGKNLGLKPSDTKLDKFYKNAAEESQQEEEKSKEKSPSTGLAEGKNLGLKPSDTKLDKFYKNAAEESQQEEEKSKEKSPSTSLSEGKNLGLKPTDAKLDKFYKNETDKMHEEEETTAEKGYVDNITQLNSKKSPLNSKNKEIEEKQDQALDQITSDSKVQAHMKIDQKKIECEFNDFFDETIIFLTEEKKMNPNALVSFNVSFSYMGEVSKLELEGEVSSFDHDGEGKSFVSVKLSPQNAKKASDFMYKFESRQRNVSEFLKMTKGF